MTRCQNGGRLGYQPGCNAQPSEFDQITDQGDHLRIVGPFIFELPQNLDLLPCLKQGLDSPGQFHRKSCIGCEVRSQVDEHDWVALKP